MMITKRRRFDWLVLIICLLILLPQSRVAADQKEDLDERIKVEVLGQTNFESDISKARDRALKDAFRAALEKALGARVTTATTMEGLTITSDVVISQTWGHILSYKITKEYQSKDKYYIQLTAEVSSDARWWAEFEGSLSVNSLHVKDLTLQQSYVLDDQVSPGGLSKDKVLVIPVKGETYALMAVHTESLQVVWRKNLNSKLTTPLVTDGEWIVAVTDREITVLNLLYGWIKWSYDLKESVNQKPVTYNGNLYVTTQKGNLYVLGLNKDDLIWKYNSQSYFISAPAIAGERAYFTDSQGYLHVLDIARKSRVFKRLINPKLYATAPTPTSIFTYLAWNDGNDTISALDSVSGETIWSFIGDVAKTSSVIPPYLFNDKILGIFIHGNHSRVYLLDAKTGHRYWTKDMDETVIEVAGASKDLIVLNTWQGIRILDPEFGAILWESGAAGLKTQVVSGEDRLYYLYDQNVDIYW